MRKAGVLARTAPSPAAEPEDAGSFEEALAHARELALRSAKVAQAAGLDDAQEARFTAYRAQLAGPP